MSFFGGEKTLFKLFGLPIKANISWLFLVALIMMSLAEGWLPGRQGIGPGHPWYAYWGLAAVMTMGLFASLIVHELCHSLVARKVGMPVSGITLFIFGGVSQLEDEPPTAGSEFAMAIVGPLSSVFIGLVMIGLYFVGGLAGWNPAVLVVLQYLGIINFMLAAFNSLPAFPLDGGRVLRSIVWGVTDDLRIATQVAVRIGAILGFALMAFAIFLFIQGAWLPGLWLLVIGYFLRQAALSNLQMVMMRRYLEGEKVRRFMTTDVVSVDRDMDLETFVNDLVFHHRFSYYPVVDEQGKLVGIASARAPREVEPDRWSERRVADIMREIDKNMTLRPNADAVDALSTLRKLEESRAVVVEDGKPVGMLSLRDLLGFLALKIDLEPRGPAMPNR